MSDINWSKEIVVSHVFESDKRILEKAKRKEQKQLNKGWKWYKVNDKLRVLIPFDKKGNITPQGKAIIERQLKLLKSY